MSVLMSNFCGEVWGLESGGQSAFWNDWGDLVAILDGTTSGLLLVDDRQGSWIGSVLG